MNRLQVTPPDVTSPDLPMNPLASLFNLAGPDVIIIGGIIMLLFGAKRLPELARGVGQAMREFTKSKDEPVSEPPEPPKPA